MTETLIDPRLPAPADCVTRLLIDRRAAETPDKVYAVFPDGERWTYARLRKEVRQAAAGLAALGVGQGDHVVSWLPNGQDALRTWYAINYLGAVYVPINTAYKGGLLAHVIENSDAWLIVAHRDLAPRLEDVDLARLTTLVRIGGDASPCAGLTVHGPEALAPEGAEPPELTRPVMPWDVQSIIYTSGTTGPSKGVLSSYAHLTATGNALPLGPEDRYMANLPLFHVGGTLPCHTMLARGGSVSMIESFRTETFWDMIRETETTFVILLGVMAQFLAKVPPAPGDADNPLRLVCLIPYDFDATDFAARFGVRIMSLFNMTEVSCPIVTELDPTIVHSAGRPRDGVEARIVDENDCEVGPGVAGELVVRAESPWVLNSGYYKNPEATAKAWRNGWFHTGDGFRRDAAGNWFFVDRIKDAIRRRGENISSYEVEAEALAHPDVNECAAVAVKSEVSEDEVLIVVAPAPGRTVDPAALHEFLVPRMAHFMLPRYIRVVEALPKTPTAKVRKLELREDGVTGDTWDREAAGIRVRREKIGG
ncbi:MAG: AMP-binding protein [Pseudomonadota bacterium]|nr:AMP-binding protein [Pseudomonadota bacterium]